LFWVSEADIVTEFARASLIRPGVLHPYGSGQNLRGESALAAAATAGRVAGSSADGEQPKFSTLIHDAAGAVRHVLVKFSPPRGTPFGER
jgi:hypothetical protein